MTWATVVAKAGVWGPGGVASDGTDTFVTTGNGNTAATWSGSEAVIRLQPGPVFSGSTTDFWAPTNWASLDMVDADLGGSGPILVDVPGATPSALVVALGKDGKAYLLNRNNLGGVSAPLTSANVSGNSIIQAAATYRTTLGTYVVFRPTTGTLTAFRITATNPPTIATGWSISSSGRTSPFVTTTDGFSNAIVWAAGADQRLRAYDGDTGAVIFAGGGANELMAGVRSFNTGIAARGRIYCANDNKVRVYCADVYDPDANGHRYRHSHPNSYCYSYRPTFTHTYCNSYSHNHTYCHGYSYSCAFGYTDRDSYSSAFGYTDRDGYSCAFGYTNRDSHSCAFGYADARAGAGRQPLDSDASSDR